MIRRMLKYLVISVVVMISFFVQDVDARSLACSYDFSYTGYNNNEEEIRVVFTDDGDKLSERWVKISASDNNPLNNISRGSDYTNRLVLDDFKDGDDFVCPRISYTIVKGDNNGFRVYIGNSDAGYLNSISPSSTNVNNDLEEGDTSNKQDNNSSTDNNSNNDSVDGGDASVTPSPSPTDSGLEKIEWETVGEDVDATCEDTMGELIDELQRYFDMIKIIAPILLIVFGALDFAGATIGMNNKDTMEKSTSKFVRRCIAALAIFFLPTLIEVLLTLPGLPEIEDVLCGLK